AGSMLADAGERADTRGDVPASVDLLGRAVALLADSPRRRRLMVRFADRLYAAGEATRAEQELTDAVAVADRAGDEGAGALARLILVFVPSSTRSSELTDVLHETERLGAVLTRVGDPDGARLAEASAAFFLFAMGRAQEAVDRARPLVELGAGELPWQREARTSHGAALVWGPTPVDAAILAIEAQISSAEGAISAQGAHRGIGRLLMLQGRFDEARARIEQTRAVWEQLGNRHELNSSVSPFAQLAHLSGNHTDAARLYREAYEGLRASGDRSFASTNAAELGQELLDLEDYDQAWHFATIARETSSSDDVISQGLGRAVQARVLSHRGEHASAESLAAEATKTLEPTDYLEFRADLLVHQAHVLREAGKPDEAL